MAKIIVRAVDAHVGALVRRRRREIKMNLTTLADAIGVLYQQVQQYEKGTNRIGSSRLVEIANVLGVPPTYFFKGAPTAVRVSAKQQDSMDYVAAFVGSKEGAALIRAFVKLPKDVRRSIANMVEKVAENE